MEIHMLFGTDPDRNRVLEKPPAAELIPCRQKPLWLWCWGFFFREPSAAGGYYWLPAPLGWNLANAGNTKTVENNRNRAELLLHDVYFIRSKDPQIHNNHSCKTTINWFRRTCNESKIIILLAIYNVHDAIYRSTHCTFLFFLFSILWSLLVSLTVKTRQINAPKWPPKISCCGNLPDSPARITRRIYSPEKSAISTRCEARSARIICRFDPPFRMAKIGERAGWSAVWYGSLTGWEKSAQFKLKMVSDVLLLSF